MIQLLLNVSYIVGILCLFAAVGSGLILYGLRCAMLGLVCCVTLAVFVEVVSYGLH